MAKLLKQSEWSNWSLTAATHILNSPQAEFIVSDPLLLPPFIATGVIVIGLFILIWQL
jgi:hypothetical protein